MLIRVRSEADLSSMADFTVVRHEGDGRTREVTIRVPEWFWGLEGGDAVRVEVLGVVVNQALPQIPQQRQSFDYRRAVEEALRR